MKRPVVIFGSVVLVTLGVSVGCNQIAGIREGDPLGDALLCEVDADCPPADEPDCATLVGCQDDVCAYARELDGKVVTEQIGGDCALLVCDGDGGVRLQVDDTDTDDGDPCTLDTCASGLPTHTPGREVPCYEGAPDTRGVGLCQAGTQQCDEAFQPVGGCEGQVLPADETCLTAGDDDCNGETNEGGEGCVCTPSINSPCYTGPAGTRDVGICQAGSCLCNDDGTACVTACAGEVTPANEDCATPTDDDCDGGAVDAEDGCACVANETVTCYTGPAGTLGVGLCAAGTETCNAAGTDYAAVCDDVVPTSEDCTTAADDDCDGTAVTACTGTAAWLAATTTTGSSSYSTVGTVASDGAGNDYASGSVYRFGTTVDLGGGALTPPNHGTGYAAYVVKRSPIGAHLWSVLLPCAQASAQFLPRVAVAGAHILVAFTAENIYCDFGDGSTYTEGVVVVRLNATTGAFVSKAVIGNRYTQLYAIAGVGTGAYLGGYQDSSVDLGSGSFSNRPFVARLDGNSAVVWDKSFLASGVNNRVVALAVLPGDAVAFAGNAYGTTIDLGSGAKGDSNVYENHYYGVLEPDGAPRWDVVFTTSSTFSSGIRAPVALAVDPAGNVVALSQTRYGLDVGTTTLMAYQSYLARLGGSDGAVEDVLSLDTQSTSDRLLTVSIDALGHVAVGAFLTTSASVGGPAAPSAGHYVTKLDAVRAHLWTKALPLYSSSETMGLAVHTDSSIFFAAGKIYGVQTIDGTMVGTSGYYEILFGRLAP